MIRLLTPHAAVTALLVLTATAGCDSTAPAGPEIAMNATWAGEPWPGGAGAYLTGGELTIHGWTPVSSPTMAASTVSITVQYAGVGTYALAPAAARVTYLVGGDAVTAEYGTTAQHTGTLVIEEATQTRVRGHVMFDAAASSSYRPAGDAARFQGTFTARIQ